jgi:hypothetical protein
MGWMMKTGLFLFALFIAGLGAWIIAIPILVVLVMPPFFRGRRSKHAHGSESAKSGTGLWLNVIGASLVLLSLVAISSGGVFSPVVFFTAGMALLLRHRIRFHVAAQSSPVENSILLHSPLNPFRWYAVAEAKISTRDISNALSGVNTRLLLVSSSYPRILLVFSVSSFGRSGAESGLIEKVRSAAKALVPLGVYLLPLDSTEAAAATQLQSEQIELRGDDLRQSISVSDYGAVAVEPQHGFVRYFELYSRSDTALKPISILSGSKERSRGLLTVREFFQEALQKTGAPHPDRYTAFLSSMAATEGETLGQRITKTETGQGQALLVASLGTPQVELMRAQLQAVAKVYE